MSARSSSDRGGAGREHPRGTAHLTGAEGRYYGVPYQDLDVRSVLHGRVTEVTEGRASVGGVF